MATFGAGYYLDNNPASVGFGKFMPDLTVTLNGVAYHGNDLSSTNCPLQTSTDCDDSVFATFTLSGNLSDLSK
jgi:hypothetical protein